MEELVSILIPSYNAEKWMRETIESALSQTWPNKEIIVVDDGSTDNSLMIARQYESNLVRVVSQENKGGCAARNKALEFAKGDYIQWLDADDILAPDKIEKQMEMAHSIANPRVLLSCSWGIFHYRYWKAKFVSDALWRDLKPVEWIYARFMEGLWMSNSAWLVSRTLTELAGPWDQRLSMDQDGEYFCRVVSMSDKVVFVPNAREYVRRSNLGSVSKASSRRALESHFLSKKLCIRYLLSLEDSKKTREACIKLLQVAFNYYYAGRTDFMEKATSLAHELGGNITPPVYRRKFEITKKILGFKFANDIRLNWARAKRLIVINWDKLLYNLSKKLVIFHRTQKKR